ncbi:hypothetical protein D4S03_03880 [bacterium]|nr:MAG: hypothetical protein D4S03_03880 [bacterium]
MLDGTNEITFTSMRLLYDSVRENKKPLLFWIGAGASAWCKYPLWNDVADIFHTQFLKYENSYDKIEAVSLLQSKRYQDYFELCRKANERRYFRTLVDCFKPKPLTPVYKRLITSLSSIRPLHIVTTNIDESLENNLTEIITIQRTDLERCIGLLNTNESFLCKLHGSVSSIESIIFSSRDYVTLNADSKYIALLKHILSETMVVFVGYGLSEDYVLDLLSSNDDLKSIFGDGPHFAILTEERLFPNSVKIIKYIPEPYRDYRSVIQVVDEIKIAHNKDNKKEISGYELIRSENITSAHLISDIYPPGRWDSSANIEIVDDHGSVKKIFTGHGIDNSEMPLTVSTAMHDLVVGLICFDTVYVPLTALSRTHTLLGSDYFWELVRNNCLKFIEWEGFQGIVYPSSASFTGGDLCSFETFNPDGRQITIQQKIRKHLIPIPGKEKEAEDNFILLETKIEFIDRSKEPSIPDLTRGLLYRQSIRSLIGMSGGTPSTSLPHWMTFPVLRVANLIRIASACQLLGIASTKLEFGSDALAGPAFATASGELIADQMASYVIAGKFDTDIGLSITQDPSILNAIIKFRDSQEAAVFRKEILSQLSLCLGNDFVSSVNGRLKSVIPPKILQAAHDKLSGLYTPISSASKLTRALWNNTDYTEKALALWKKRSARELNDYCLKYHVNRYDLCPCGSGEKLRFCCEESLKP